MGGILDLRSHRILFNQSVMSPYFCSGFDFLPSVILQSEDIHMETCDSNEHLKFLKQ